MVEKVESDGTLKIVDTDDVLTKEELANLKMVARMWSNGRVVVSVLLALGTFAIVCIQSWDTVAGFLRAKIGG